MVNQRCLLSIAVFEISWNWRAKVGFHTRTHSHTPPFVCMVLSFLHPPTHCLSVSVSLSLVGCSSVWQGPPGSGPFVPDVDFNADGCAANTLSVCLKAIILLCNSECLCGKRVCLHPTRAHSLSFATPPPCWRCVVLAGHS